MISFKKCKLLYQLLTQLLIVYNPALNVFLEIQWFECNDVIEMYDGIIFDSPSTLTSSSVYSQVLDVLALHLPPEKIFAPVVSCGFIRVVQHPPSQRN